MKFEKSYLNEYLNAMRHWDEPDDEDDRVRRSQLELRMKDALTVDRKAESHELKDWQDDDTGNGVALACWLGDTAEQVLFIYDEGDNSTKLFWVEGGFFGRTDLCLLRRTEGDALLLKETLRTVREAKHKASDLW